MKQLSTKVQTSFLLAGNTITYTATSQLPEGDIFDPGLRAYAFNVSIISHTFSNGTGTITFSGELTTIGNYAFYYCDSLTSITFPSSVTSIGVYAFYHCDSLNAITIPSSVTSIGDDAFNSCSSLASMVVESGNKYYDSRNNCNAIIETASNTLIAGCKNTIIPSSVTSIGEEAFDSCSSLTSITIPSSVTSIGDRAFNSCSSLTIITLPSSVTSIGDMAFNGCNSLTAITIPSSVKSFGMAAFGWCDSLTAITVEAIIPPTYDLEGDNPLFSDCYSTAILYVPCQSLDAYKAHAEFGKFTHIECIETASQCGN